ncbi:unnamed protein product, partial [Prorocentrum cordatum]
MARAGLAGGHISQIPSLTINGHVMDLTDPGPMTKFNDDSFKTRQSTRRRASHRSQCAGGRECVTSASLAMDPTGNVIARSPAKSHAAAFAARGQHLGSRAHRKRDREEEFARNEAGKVQGKGKRPRPEGLERAGTGSRPLRRRSFFSAYAVHVMVRDGPLYVFLLHAWFFALHFIQGPPCEHVDTRLQRVMLEYALLGNTLSVFCLIFANWRAV